MKTRKNLIKKCKKLLRSLKETTPKEFIKRTGKNLPPEG